MGLRMDRTGFGELEIFQNPEEFCYGVDAVLLADAGVQNYGFGHGNGYCSADSQS